MADVPSCAAICLLACFRHWPDLRNCIGCLRNKECSNNSKGLIWFEQKGSHTDKRGKDHKEHQHQREQQEEQQGCVQQGTYTMYKFKRRPILTKKLDREKSSLLDRKPHQECVQQGQDLRRRSTTGARRPRCCRGQSSEKEEGT